MVSGDGVQGEAVPSAQLCHGRGEDHPVLPQSFIPGCFQAGAECPEQQPLLGAVEMLLVWEGVTLLTFLTRSSLTSLEN